MINFKDLLKKIKENSPELTTLSLDELEFSEMDAKQFREVAMAMAANQTIKTISVKVVEDPMLPKKTVELSTDKLLEKFGEICKFSKSFNLTKSEHSDSNYHCLLAGLLLNREYNTFIDAHYGFKLSQISNHRLNMLLTVLECNPIYQVLTLDYLWLNNFDEKPLIRFGKFLESTTVRRIAFGCDLAKMPIGSFDFIMRALLQSKISELNIRINFRYLNIQYIKLFADAISNTKTIRSLELPICDLNDHDDKVNSILFSSLECNNTMKYVDFGDADIITGLSEASFSSFLNLIRKNTTITCIGIGENRKTLNDNPSRISQFIDALKMSKIQKIENWKPSHVALNMQLEEVLLQNRKKLLKEETEQIHEVLYRPEFLGWKFSADVIGIVAQYTVDLFEPESVRRPIRHLEEVD